MNKRTFLKTLLLSPFVSLFPATVSKLGWNPFLTEQQRRYYSYKYMGTVTGRWSGNRCGKTYLALSKETYQHLFEKQP